ncbi:unnamed protein product [Clonostachys rosea]|uniref:Ig-like domain-containing protein n=1 Tax=Bionectria ochroleuca TaxID=29856 RepID=A0ABY6V2A0_BIOOC|nr:unnamed protein product [Clonostachys rosea]
MLVSGIALLALFGQAYAGCTQIADDVGNSLTEVEQCPIERDSAGVPTGRNFCPDADAWISPGGNWGATAYTTSKAVNFRIIPISEGGFFDPIYYHCTANTDGEFIWTRDYSLGYTGVTTMS